MPKPFCFSLTSDWPHSQLPAFPIHTLVTREEPPEREGALGPVPQQLFPFLVRTFPSPKVVLERLGTQIVPCALERMLYACLPSSQAASLLASLIPGCAEGTQARLLTWEGLYLLAWFLLMMTSFHLKPCAANELWLLLVNGCCLSCYLAREFDNDLGLLLLPCGFLFLCLYSLRQRSDLPHLC